MKNSFRIAGCFMLWLLSLGISGGAIFGYSAGPPDGRTGSPSDSNLTCHNGCHNSYNLNAGTATFSISAPGSYTLGEVLDVTVSFSNSSTSKHGFELSALDGSGTTTGTFSNVDSNTQTSTGSTGINYIKHTSAGSAQSGNASWSIQWTSPSSGSPGTVTFYAAGNEADGDGNNTNDYIYTTTRQLSIGAAAATPTPTQAATPTPAGTVAVSCDPGSITCDETKFKMKMGTSKTLTTTVTGADDCISEGVTVNAEAKTGSDRITIDPESAETDENGQASFTITANKKGNARVVFSVEDSEGETYKQTVIVKVRQKIKTKKHKMRLHRR